VKKFDVFTVVRFGAAFALCAMLLPARPAAAQLKLGYIDSQKIIESYKEAQDAQKQLASLNEQWQQEAKNMQQDLQEKQDQLESQSLLLSEEKKSEKAQEIQNLYLRFQQFQQEKWGQQGEVYVKQKEFMQPVYDKINAAIRRLGAEDKYDYIFDVVAGGILYVSEGQADLTQRVLDELNKGLAASPKPAATAPKKN
jgi:Skp family chaperone for outer membrane proteins